MGLLMNKMVTNVLLLAKLNYKITKGRNSSDKFGCYSWKHGLRTPRERELFFKSLELLGLGRHFGLKLFEALGVFLAGLSAPILVL
jgi:hypothetical protein